MCFQHYCEFWFNKIFNKVKISQGISKDQFYDMSDIDLI